MKIPLMKKFLAFLLTAILLFGIAVFSGTIGFRDVNAEPMMIPGNPGEDSLIYGDINQDGEVTGKSVLLLAQYLTGHDIVNGYN